MKFNLAKRKNILIIGDIMLDKYIKCDVKRISPEAPIPVLKYVDTENILGGAANVARNLAVNNQNVELIGVVGEDKNGNTLISLLREEKIGMKYVLQSANRRTTTKSRFVSQGHQIYRLDEESDFDISKEFEEKCMNSIKTATESFDIIIISDYLKGFLTYSLTKSIIEWANQNSIPVIIDPKDKDCLKYENCTLIKPNKKEMEAFLGGEYIGDENVVKEAIALKEKIKCKYVLLTLGAKGMVFIDENNKDCQIDSGAKEVYDVTGAGDTVLSFIAMGFEGANLSFRQVEIANSAAAVKVSKFGTAVVRYEEIFQQCNENRLVTCEEIAVVSENLKKSGQRVVFTNGCFDILHPGHVRYLNEAKALGDVLILGLNSDSSVKKLKGQGRPILNQEERSELLLALESVDYVVIFNEETPLRLIKAIKPDILAKGGDYDVENIVGYAEVTENGGQIVTLPFVEGKSTTNIVDKIRNL